MIVCNNTWQPVPGNGRTIDTPDINYLPDGTAFGNTMMLAVRGTISAPRQTTNSGKGYLDVYGTNGYAYSTSTNASGWAPWQYLGANNAWLLGHAETSAAYGNKYVQVRRNGDNTISYLCRITSGTVR